jgi:hypothetical protein
MTAESSNWTKPEGLEYDPKGPLPKLAEFFAGGSNAAFMEETAMLTISGKVVGRKKPLFADWSVPFPRDLNEAGDRVTLRDLITRIVRSELLSLSCWRRQIVNMAT